MAVGVIAHVEADRAYVDSLRAKLEGARLVAVALQPKSPVLTFEARLSLVLVWSRNAETAGAANALAALARAHAGEIIVCVADGAAAPKALERLGAAIVDGAPTSSFFPGGIAAALAEANRRQLYAQAARQRASSAQTGPKAFADGMARGLAGSVAVFGVGGAAALGLEDLPNALFSIEPGYEPQVAAATLDEAAQFDEAQLAATQDEAVWAEADAIVIEAAAIDPSLADVPLANPSFERVQAARAAAFATSTPLELYMPEPLETPALMALPETATPELAAWEGPTQETAQAPRTTQDTQASHDSLGAPLLSVAQYGEEEASHAAEAPVI
ncbi:MAG: hypothetical protein AB7O04_03470 [Hyphomonadaceae bacterium]